MGCPSSHRWSGRELITTLKSFEGMGQKLTFAEPLAATEEGSGRRVWPIRASWRGGAQIANARGGNRIPPTSASRPWEFLHSARGRVLGWVLVASALLAVTACGSSSPVNTSTSTNTLPPSSAESSIALAPPVLDSADAAFVAELRAKNLAPAIPADLDVALVTDANAVCNMARLVESADIKKTDMVNMRKNRVVYYGITQEEATEVMVLSVQTYCADQVSFVRTALT